jgi:hypothetical protein
MDLLSACVFCAGLLLGTELPPWPGYSAEAGFSYATTARRYSEPGLEDISDVTPKFPLVGAGFARYPAGGLGAGTPATEWRLRVALGPSHDEQEQRPNVLGNTTSTGTGRYENFSVLIRYTVGARDSVEAGWERREHKATDLVNAGNQRYIVSEERVLSAERIDVGVGWRHRWEGLEAAVSGRYMRPNASNATAGAFHITKTALYGAGVELRAKRGRWTGSLSAERMSGSIDVEEQNAPDFRVRTLSPPALFESARLGVAYEAGKTEILLAGTYDRSRQPFVAFAVLGIETAAFEQGYHPDARVRRYVADLTVRHAYSPLVHLRAFLRSAYGDETLTLTDPTGALPARSLDIHHTGVFGAGLSRVFGSPEVTIGLAADFRLSP